MTPILLDLYCGLGGAATGYHRAGFKVIGVDIKPQPDYPFQFYQEDVIEFLDDWYYWSFGEVSAIHASPPCQRDAAITKGTNAHLRDDYPDLYPPTREWLEYLGVPYVIENPAARPDVVLCGEMFGLKVLRHRRFELGGWTMPKPKHVKHRGRVRGWRHGVYYDGPYYAVYGKGGGKATLPEAREGLGIDWSVDYDQITEAIPPAYTEYIGKALLASLG